MKLSLKHYRLNQYFVSRKIESVMLLTYFLFLFMPNQNDESIMDQSTTSQSQTSSDSYMNPL
uniref:Putative ovule protein n=1 Tax=Solanum chacoense TaxID=4108 RepID=A0A0V0GMX2_SOLCH